MDSSGQVAGVSAENPSIDEMIAADQAARGDTSAESAVSYSGPSTNDFTVAQAFGFFNILVGLMLVAGLLLFFGGFIAYLTRLGLENRLQGLMYMYWGLSILFVLIVLLGLVHYLQFHPTVVFTILAVIAVGFMAWAAIQISQQSGEDDEH